MLSQYPSIGSIITICRCIWYYSLFLSEVDLDIPWIEKRQCVSCPSTPPPCPSCPAGQECQITSQSCQQCAQSLCISVSQLGFEPSTSPTPSKGPDTGAIAGGIVGAFVLVVCIAGITFWYLRKKKQAQEDLDRWLDKTENPSEDEEKDPKLQSGMEPHDSVVDHNEPC